MATLLIFHEVDDVDSWLASPGREELAGPLGITGRLFRDSQGSNRVGMILEVPDMATFEKMLEADPTWESAKADGVRVDTALILHEV
jgi:hypothetical protein